MRAETKTGSETPNSVKRLKIAIQNTKLIQFNSVQAYLHSISSQQQSSQDALILPLHFLLFFHCSFEFISIRTHNSHNFLEGDL